MIKWKSIENLEQENKQLKERYERLKQEHIDTITRNEEKQHKIDKAIEYIKDNYLYYYDRLDDYEFKMRYLDDISKLKEILGDKENDK